MNKLVIALITTMFAVIFSILLTATLLQLATVYEGDVFPVVQPVEIGEIYKDGKQIHISGTFDKVRECVHSYTAAWIKRNPDGEDVERLTGYFGPVEYLSGHSHGDGRATYPVGTFRFNNWTIDEPRLITRGTIIVEGVYTCHGIGWWNTRSPLMAFQYPLVP